MTPTFSGEIQLAGWSESHTGGCKVTFWLSSPDELAAFRTLTTRKGNTAGHRFMAALVEIGDDELPVQAANTSLKPVNKTSEFEHNEKPKATQQAQSTEPTATKPKGGALAKLAGRWCGDPEFWMWIESTTHNGIMWPTSSAADAADFVREICGVDSRAELDNDASAARLFHSCIRGPYAKWCAARGVTQ